MFRIDTITKDWKEAGSFPAQLNLYGFWDEHCFLTKTGDLGAVLKIGGIDYESLDHAGRDYAVKRLEAALRSLDDGTRKLRQRRGIATQDLIASDSGENAAVAALPNCIVERAFLLYPGTVRSGEKISTIGTIMRLEPLCQKGLFFICPTPVYNKIAERLGGNLTEIHQQAGSVTLMQYDIGPAVPDGQIRALELGGQSTTTIDQVALAFTAPSNLPPAKVYEQAINAEL